MIKKEIGKMCTIVEHKTHTHTHKGANKVSKETFNIFLWAL